MTGINGAAGADRRIARDEPPEKWTPEGENLAWSARSADVCHRDERVSLQLYALGEVRPVKAPPRPLIRPQDAGSTHVRRRQTGKIIWQHLQNMFQTDAPFHRLGWSSPVGDPETATSTRWVRKPRSSAATARRESSGTSDTEEFGLISTFGGRTASPAINDDQLFITGVSFGWATTLVAASHLRV